MVKTIYTSKGDAILVDDEDYERLNKYKWCLSVAGYPCKSWRVDGRKTVILMHRMIMADEGYPLKGNDVDHINRDKLDNRKSNLRVVSHKENGWNLSKNKNNTSGYPGVSCNGRSKRNPWEAKIRIGRDRAISLGYYPTPESAYQAYLMAKAKYHTINPKGKKVND